MYKDSNVQNYMKAATVMAWYHRNSPHDDMIFWLKFSVKQARNEWRGLNRIEIW